VAKSIEAWKPTQDMGTGGFVFLYGVLGWGLPAGILAAVVDRVLSKGLDFTADFWTGLLPRLGVFLVAGALWGFWTKRRIDRLGAFVDIHDVR
jgi:hypothetical protein